MASLAMQGIKRTSQLHAPIMQLFGHGGEVYTLRFSPGGELLASGSFDKMILLWKTYGEHCDNYMSLKVCFPCLSHPLLLVHVVVAWGAHVWFAMEVVL